MPADTGMGLTPVELPIGTTGSLTAVVLRPWRDADEESVLEAFRDPDIVRWTTHVAAPDITMVRSWIASRHEGWATGSLPSWAVTGTPAGGGPETFYGSVGLKRFAFARQDPPPVHAAVMYWLLPPARGHGLATTLAAEMARWAWTAHGLRRIELHHELDNRGSCRVAERAGYVLEGSLRRSFATPHGWVDEHLHAAVVAQEASPAR